MLKLRVLAAMLAMIIASCASTHVFAQTLDSVEVADYSTPKTYEIGAVEVDGAIFSDATAIKSIAGLKVGDQVRIPGPEITRAVKKLMELRLFTDVQVLLTSTLEDVALLKIAIVEQPRLSLYRYTGIKKRYHDDLNERLDEVLTKGGIVNENVKQNAANQVKSFFREKGFLDTKVNITEKTDSIRANSVVLTLDIDRGPRVKIEDIVVNGNQEVSDRKIRKLMKETRRKRNLFSKSKFNSDDYADDKEKVINYYNTIGFRDARILNDSIYRGEDGDLIIELDLNEGNRYYFRDISFKGNTIYTEKQLREVLGIQKGDVYNKELLDTRLSFSQDGRDVSSLYLDNGYLFFNVDPVETAVSQDSIDLEIRINEGAQATIENVTITGNDRTHENVIRRELRVRPGDKFSRADIVRSQRELINLGFFDPEALGINTPVNQERGTVDIEFDVTEKANDQLELSMGWAGSGYGGLFGTVGVSFNNFSLRKALQGKAWRPYPTGDAQRLGIRFQSSGPNFLSSSLSFTEPWLGGKRPTSLTSALNYNFIGNGYSRDSENFGRFNIYTASTTIGTRLKWPDDNFLVSGGLRIQHYDLDNYTQGAIFRTDEGAVVNEGNYTNLALEATIARTSIADPIFPRSGAKVSLGVRVTPPYSLIGRDVSSDRTTQERYRWIEYHRYRFNVEWYKSLVGKLVVKTSAKMGFLASYSDKLGTSPFERFELGGNGLNNSQLSRYTGTEVISSRGYDKDHYENNFQDGSNTPASLFNKLSLELRYPISLNPNATVFVLGFVEGSNTWRGFDDYNPFDLKRSAGAGLRVFLPMFGTLGFDYGIGFDKINSDGTVGVGREEPSFKNLGQFNIILGFEPE